MSPNVGEHTFGEIDVSIDVSKCWQGAHLAKSMSPNVSRAHIWRSRCLQMLAGHTFGEVNVSKCWQGTHLAKSMSPNAGRAHIWRSQCLQVLAGHTFGEV